MAASTDSSDDGGETASDDDVAGERCDVAGSASDTAASEGRPCPACGEPMYHRHCKYVCPQHGVVYDCSDTFY